MSIYARTRQPVAELNATLTTCFATVKALNGKFETSRRPFVLYSRRGDFLARYATLETLTAAAQRREGWLTE
jgi:hypothetical protein